MQIRTVVTAWVLMMITVCIPRSLYSVNQP
jgi:hypothetical protein